MQNECLNSRVSSTDAWFSFCGLSAEKNAVTMWGKNFKMRDCIINKCFNCVQHWELLPCLLILAFNLEAQWSNCAYSSVRKAYQSPRFERVDLSGFKLDQKRRVNFCCFLYVMRKWHFTRMRWIKLLRIYYYISVRSWNPSALYIWFSDVRCMMK